MSGSLYLPCKSQNTRSESVIGGNMAAGSNLKADMVGSLFTDRFAALSTLFWTLRVHYVDQGHYTLHFNTHNGLVLDPKGLQHVEY